MRNKTCRDFLSLATFTVCCLMLTAPGVYAQSIGASGLVSRFDSSWIQFQAGGTAEDGIITPGVGGQKFDAEYLLYQMNGSKLSLALQTGFNVETGKLSYNGKNYFAGDLALSFDGNASSGVPSSFEYAVDFGLKTRDYNSHLVDAGTGTGIDQAGVYGNVGWNNNIAFPNSSPFAMTDGDKIDGALLGGMEAGSGSGTITGDLSYYRIVTLNLDEILGSDWDLDGFILDAHWTMSCGNDEINGRLTVAPVPEPATMLLFGTGLLGLSGVLRRRKK